MRAVARRGLALALVLSSVGLVAPTAGAQTPAPTPSPTASPAADPGQGAPPVWDIPARIGYEINSWLTGLVGAAVAAVLEFLGKTIFSTPRIDLNDRVREIWRFSVVVADALLLIFILAGSGMVMAGSELNVQLTAKELVPRALVAAVAVNLSLVVAGEVISLSNALTQALLGMSLDPAIVTQRISEQLLGGIANPFLALLALGVAIVGLLVIVAYVMRIAVLVVVLAAAPLLLVTHGLPQTDEFARKWWRVLFAVVAAPVAQSFLLAAAVQVFLSGDGAVGLGGGGLIDLLVIGCLLYLMFRIPLKALDIALSGAGSKAWGRAKRSATTAMKATVAA